MKRTSLLFAMAAVAFAQVDSAITSAAGLNPTSALAILESAVPTSLQNLALTNPSSASAVLMSEFASGNKPAWFTTLPESVQTYLVPVTTVAQAPGIVLSALPTEATSFQQYSNNASSSTASEQYPTSFPTPVAGGTISGGMSMPYGTNGTNSGVAMSTGSAMTPGNMTSSSTPTMTMTTSSTGGGSMMGTSVAGGAGSAPTSSAAAAMFSGAFEAGVVGVLGMMGAFAL